VSSIRSLAIVVLVGIGIAPAAAPIANATSSETEVAVDGYTTGYKSTRQALRAGSGALLSSPW
jgi:hypothetical protein